MKPYIFGRRNLIHIIDVKETLKGILLAKTFISRVVSDGKDVLFVGTKRQARKSVEDQAQGSEMHWVTDRWLGGTLTNFNEIRKRIGRLEQLEQLDTDGMLDTYSKKQGASLRREMRKISRNLGGIRKMVKLPGALVIVDQKREIIAIREARKMHIPVVCLLDTDSDPDVVDIPIPGNDDAMRAIDLVLSQLSEAVRVAVGSRTKAAVDAPETAAEPRRRSARPMTARAENAPAPAAAAPAAPAVEPAAPAVEPTAPAAEPAAPAVEPAAPAVEPATPPPPAPAEAAPAEAVPPAEAS